jgi:hypothetical protein
MQWIVQFKVFVVKNGDRPMVHNVIIMLTAGKDVNGSNLTASYELAIAKNITIYAIGVGNGKRDIVVKRCA